MRRTHLRWMALALLWTFALPTPGSATDVDGPDDCTRTPVDFGDAPEGVAAYPGVIGHFPTCVAPGAPGTLNTSGCGLGIPAPGPTGFVMHVHNAAESQYWLGCGVVGQPPQGIDGEADGKVNDNGGPFSACNPTQSVDCVENAFGMTFGQDECYGSTDAGIASPVSFTTCSAANLTFTAYNCGAQRTVMLNILVDWNQDGDWNDDMQCAQGCVREWEVVNVPIQLAPGCNTIISPTFLTGPNPGYGWLRLTISDEPVPPDFTWNGSVSLPGQALTNGETEDYPVTIKSPPPPCPNYEDWGDAPEEVQAYPGVPGRFPTCAFPSPPGTFDVACQPLSTPPGPTGFVRHISSANDNVQFWLGCPDLVTGTLGVDSETNGKVNDTGAPQSACDPAVPVDDNEFFGLTWGQDEAYGDADAGVAGPILKFQTCQNGSVDFSTYNCKNAPADAFLNILVDMNGDGDWNDNFLCSAASGQCAYEWAVKNVPIVVMPGCQMHTSPLFLMGPNSGPGWMRITLTTAPVSDDFPWNGSAGPGGDGFFVGGETEDYPVMIRPDNVGVNDPQTIASPSLSMAPLSPNPAGSQVMVRFTLPHAEDVSLAAYDVAGRKLVELARGRLEAGEHRVAWNFDDGQGRPVPAGYYIVRLRVGDHVLTQRGIRVR